MPKGTSKLPVSDRARAFSASPQLPVNYPTADRACLPGQLFADTVTDKLSQPRRRR